MAKYRTIQTNFVGGEMDPTGLGRVDSERYGKALVFARNVYIQPLGGAFRREGLKYIATTTTSQAGRLVPFSFNTDQDYLIIFTPGEFKVYKDDVLQATVTSSPISALTATHIAEMRWTQSADTLILVHEDVQPIKITRTSHTAWTAAAITFTNIPSYDYGSGAEPVISGTRGWPKSITFFASRTWLGGLGSRPQTLLASKVGDFFNLISTTTNDDDGLDITIDDDQVNGIQDLVAGRGLQIFTSGGEFEIRPSLGDPITPNLIATQLRRQTKHGSESVKPVSLEGTTLFIERGGFVLRSFLYNDFEQNYTSSPITTYNSSVIRTPVAMTHRASTEGFIGDYVYIANSDGTVAVLSYMRDQNLAAFSLFETEGVVEDIITLNREIYAIVKRTINSATVRFIEKLDSTLKLDAAETATNGSPTTSWTGFDHLDGESCSVFGDDFILADATPASGAITTGEEVEDVEIGLPFLCRIKTVPLEVPVQGQPISGEIKRLVYTNVRLYESRQVIVKVNGNTFEPSFVSFGDFVLDQPVSLFSGWKKSYLRGFAEDAQVEITQTEPLEFKVLSLVIAFGYR